MPILPVDHARIAPFRSRAAKDRVALGPTANTDWFAHVEDTEILCTGALMRYGAGLRLKGLWTIPTARRRGLGTAMIEYRIAEAERRCVPYVETITVIAPVFEKLGFKVIGKSGLGVPILRKLL